MSDRLAIEYEAASDTLLDFHNDPAPMRCIVGPVGSGKTSAAMWEICYELPAFLYRKYGWTRTRWAVVRNTWPELRDTTLTTIREWFPEPLGQWHASDKRFTIRYPLAHDDKQKETTLEVELLLRFCNRPDEVGKFKSLEITGYWIDESIEVPEEVKKMLKNRIGRFPPRSPVRYGIETTNPPDVEHPLYWQFDWNRIPSGGPAPNRRPLEGHSGYWQKPGENAQNLRPGYYDDLRRDYQADPDWIKVYIEGQPGVILQGQPVYPEFSTGEHIAVVQLEWAKRLEFVGEGRSRERGLPIYVGWDNSGNTPAAVAAQLVAPFKLQVLREFWTERMGIVDFAKLVKSELAIAFPGAEFTHYADPAGSARYSQREGGFTSNAELMAEVGIETLPGEQNPVARRESVRGLLVRRDGLLLDPSCRRLRDGFVGGYCYPPHQTLPGEYKPDPIKNKYSHVHDALQYLCCGLMGAPEPDPEERRRQVEEAYERNKDWNPLDFIPRRR